ncbi:chromosome segregation protein SMC [Lentilactobacillus senioris]|uniref:chromosome segregation protein SMC n=1 Tax=Lentilactobacillus senioris TaxID=931534 RepID=UPI0022831F8D|nr:chromosome segregation protein SMC [Lentilactobacillus senioris]MCY9806884.1 chromosome segregation protein SMC [Lentilactobacillus senioris]
MQLKTIKLSGFKSFAEKTKIELRPGTTIIVGPNGSGKSNITEAIRWVLGEQSAKTLRGQKMGDVIFSGAQQKAAMNLAQVSLLFDNSDHYLDSPYTEIEVTRKLFRNGESWYGINGQECRLKDITSLFMDSGVGADGFSIISQGNVEEVFNSTAESRRSIVETVAGIFQYKQQKKTAEAKIVKVEDNLNRVNDIIYELTNRLPELAKQKDIAVDYLAQKTKLNQLKKQKELSNWRRLTVKTEKLANEIQNLQEIKKTAETSLTNCQQHLTATKLALTNQQNLITDQVEQLQRLVQLESELKASVKLTQQERAFHEQTKIDLEKRLAANKQQIQELKNKEASLDQQLVDNQRQQANYQQEVNQLTAQLAQLKQDGTRELAQLQVQYVELIKQQSKITEQVNNHQLTLKQNEQRLIELKNNEVDLIEKQTDLNQQQQQLSNRLTGLKQELLDNEQKQTAQLKQQEQLTSQYNRLQANWLAQLKQLEQLKSQLEYHQQNEYQPFYQGVTNLMQHKDQFAGIYGPVADYIQTSSQYVLAIETALGGRLQNVIVDTNSTAQMAVKWLSEGKRGRVTFLPMTAIQAISRKKINTAVRSINGFLGSAEELVEFPESFLAIKSYLLANTLVSENLAAAIEISKASGQRFKVVSLDGQVVNPGGSITGGKNSRPQAQLLTAKSETARLKQTVVQKNEQLQQVETTVKQVQQQLETTKQLVETDQQIRLQLTQKQQQIITQLADNKQIVKQSAHLTAQNHNEQSELTKVMQSIKTKKQSPEQLAAQITVIQQKITDQERQNEQVANQKEDLTTQLTSNQQQLSQLQVQSEYLTNGKQETKQQLDELHSNTHNLLQQIKQLAAKLATTKEERINTQLQQLETKKQSTKGLKQQLEDELNRLNNQVDADTNGLSQIKVQLTKLQADLELKLTEHIKTQEALNHVQQILVDQFDYQLSEIKSASNQQANTDVDSQIKLLEKGVEELGPVNVNAIDEYQQVFERNEFLTNQKADLIDSIEELRDTISMMDQESSQRFLTTFKQLDESFQQVFQRLFGGGKAKLELTDSKHPLTTGIEIMAMPPGKKYRALSLLSGGERTLTAIALLFAILEIKPVPFVILDEAEAALDPVNVDRFARYVKEFATQTQFIVVTHRKETMVYGDQLYGVTMQDSGVSKVVSVALQTNNEVRT